MKILLVNPSCGSGSTGKIVADLYHIIKNNGHEVKVAYSYYASKVPSCDTYKIGTKLDYYCHNLLSRITDRSGFYSTLQTKRFIRYIDEYNPDVIHFHNLHGYYLNINVLLKHLAQKKTKCIFTLHDCWLFTGHCAYFDSANCEKWQNECGNCPLLKDYPKSLLMDRSKNNLQQKIGLLKSLENPVFVPVSDWLGKLLNQSHLKSSEIKVIKNGIDLSVFKQTNSKLREKLHIPENKIVILGVASPWNERKGLKDIIAIAKKTDFQAVVVGVSDEQIESLPKNVLGITRTENQIQLAEFYSMADVFLNPTYSDNYPTTNLEAIACGTPVITYDTGGSPEAINEDTGLVVPQGDINAMINGVMSITKNTRSINAEKCISYAKDHFPKSQCFNKYLEIYTR